MRPRDSPAAHRLPALIRLRPQSSEGPKQRRSQGGSIPTLRSKASRSNRLRHGSLAFSWRPVSGSAGPPTSSRRQRSAAACVRHPARGRARPLPLSSVAVAPKRLTLIFPPVDPAIAARGIARSQKHKGTAQRNANAAQKKDKHHTPCHLQRQLSRRRTTPTAEQGTNPQHARGPNPHRTKRSTRTRTDGSPREDGC
jgi:hypothetical protein